jgi:hypothetical protein
MKRFTTTIHRHIQIAAPVHRVWRALCLPDEVAQWDGAVHFPIDAPVDYPQPGQRVRWHTTGTLLRVLIDEPREVIPNRRLRSNLSLGPARFDEVYTLETCADNAEIPADQCLLNMSLTLHVVAVPLRRLWYRHFVSDTPASMESALRSIRIHCETTPDSVFDPDA